jgi:DNA topoisomerase II
LFFCALCGFLTSAMATVLSTKGKALKQGLADDGVQLLDDISHVLQVPGMYVGSTEQEMSELVFIVPSDEEADDRRGGNMSPTKLSVLTPVPVAVTTDSAVASPLPSAITSAVASPPTATNSAVGSPDTKVTTATNPSSALPATPSSVADVKSLRAKQYTMRVETVPISPAFVQIFLEVLTNAGDHARRVGTGVTKIKVDLDPVRGIVRVWNDGQGIAAEQRENLGGRYVLEAVFGQLRCGSNFKREDTGNKTHGGVAGAHGYGVKLTNIFSTYFHSESHDVERQCCVKQVWTGNMRNTDGPQGIKKKTKKGHTLVEYTPDWARLGVSGETEGARAAALRTLEPTVWAMAAVTPSSVQVYLNGRALPVRDLKAYADLVAGHAGAVAYASGEKIDVAVVPRRPGMPQGHIAFANGIPVPRGKHVDFAARAITKLINERVFRGKGASITPKSLQSACLLVVSCTVREARFAGGQTKQQLDNKPSEAGWKLDLSDNKPFLAALKRSGAVELLGHEREVAELREAQSKGGDAGNGDISVVGGTSMAAVRRLQAIPGYAHAPRATGRRHRASEVMPLTLWIPEGDSAKGMWTQGTTPAQKEYFGCYPIKGKPLNASDKKLAELQANTELRNIVDILGLDLINPPTSPDELRYQRVVGMTDQDVDGGHIMGLLLAFFHRVCPDMVRQHPSFISRLATPLVRVEPKGRAGAQPAHEFMSLRSFEQWYNALSARERARYHKPKHIKGLGTSTMRQSKAIFTNLDRHLIALATTPEGEALLSDCFRKKGGPEARKALLVTHADAPADLDYTRTQVPLEEYLRTEVMAYMYDDVMRSLPDAVDGLKPVQRKLLEALLRHYGRATLASGGAKVADVAGTAVALTRYGHGEKSMEGAIFTAGAPYTGGNNIYLCLPLGNFGDRHGNAAASSRYTFTGPPDILRALLPAEDMPLLERAVEEGVVVEPRRFVPVLPLLLINGCVGIGTGWSTNVPMHDPCDLVAWARAHITRLRAERSGSTLPLLSYPPLAPAICGFHGTRTDVGGGRWQFDGVVELLEDGHTVHVTDLPVRTDEFLLGGSKRRDPTKSELAWMERHPHVVEGLSGGDSVNLFLRFQDAVAPDVLTELKARARLMVDWSNAHAFDAHTVPPRLFSGAEEVCALHAEHRLALNVRRRDYMLASLRREETELANKIRFLGAGPENIDDYVVVRHRPRAEIDAELAAKMYDRLLPRTAATSTEDESREAATDVDHVEALAPPTTAEEEDDDDSGGFNYLLNMRFSQATTRQLLDMQRRLDTTRTEIARLDAMDELDFWSNDLDKFEQAYAAYLEEREYLMNNKSESDDSTGGHPPSKQPRKKTIARPTSTTTQQGGGKKKKTTTSKATKKATTASKGPAAPRAKKPKTLVAAGGTTKQKTAAIAPAVVDTTILESDDDQ